VLYSVMWLSVLLSLLNIFHLKDPHVPKWFSIFFALIIGFTCLVGYVLSSFTLIG
jgi:hypothetical protein